MPSTVQIVYVPSSLCLSRGQLWNVDRGLQGPHKLFKTFVFSPLSAHGVKPYFHRMYPRREGYFQEYVMSL